MGAKDKVKSAVEGNSTLHRFLGTRGKRLAAAGVTAAAVIALTASVFLNANKDGGYVTLFPGITREENIEVMTVLNSRGIAAKRNSEGEVTVPENQFGDIILEMSELGYPKTALPFDIFSDNMSFTTTEFEKRQYLLMNLQDRLERTLKDMSGIKNAIVTLNVSDESNYVWDDQASDSTASVSLTMLPSYELSADKVAAIKNLVANSVPRLQPESVTVVNADTMQEMVSGDLGGESYYGLSRLDFESSVEERLVDKITNVLTLAYPPSKLRISATVVIDYDKMITENLQYEPQENGQGVVERFSESYSGSGVTGAGGVAGEENNTDIPAYGTGIGNDTENTGDYSRDVDYLVGYIKQQIEKDNVKLQKATVAITVNDDNLTEAKRQQLIEAASKAANIAPEDIVVSSFQIADTGNAGNTVANNNDKPVQGPATGEPDPKIIIAGAAVLFILLLALLILFLRHNAKKNREEDQELFGDAVETVEEDNPVPAAESQSSEDQGYQISDSSSPVEKVRYFAKTNPQIIAAMIRLWLKEEEQEE